jgi:hypothetical protein
MVSESPRAKSSIRHHSGSHGPEHTVQMIVGEGKKDNDRFGGKDLITNVPEA